ncbi:MAG: metallophosphoesterase family protein [Gammaproteobacteria bacterium]|nr:metallophosphoesterase family protein [Gammaproteobacteria bacterium]
MLWLKRIVTAVAVFFLVILVFYGIARTYVVYTDSQIEGNRAPYFQKQAADAMSVLWHTDEPEIGVVRYGLSPEKLDTELNEELAGEAHELRLTNLQAGQRYYYAIGNTDAMKYGGSENDWFMTAPETGTDTAVRLWVIGDSGKPGDIAWSVRDAMKSWVKENPREGKPYIDQWLTLGDNAYRSGSNQQYRFAFFDSYSSILNNIAPWPGYGNHDARRWTFFDIFSLPEQAESGGVASATEHYYSFDYANVHTVMLDSQDSDRDSGSEMLNWLKRDLEAYQASGQDWLIVAFHHPPYSKGSHDSDDEGDSGGRMVDMRQTVLPVLEQYGADLVMSGHSHGYERSYLMDCHYGNSAQFSEKNIVSRGVEGQHIDFIKAQGAHSGTVYVVAGASAKVDRADMNHPAMAVSMMKAGSLLIDIEGNYLVARYLNADAEVEDEFTIEKSHDDSWKAHSNQSYAGCQAD